MHKCDKCGKITNTYHIKFQSKNRMRKTFKFLCDGCFDIEAANAAENILESLKTVRI